MSKNFSNHIFQINKKTKIKNDVWIGNNCLIKSGIVIHTGAIVGMGSVVTKDISPYEIWGGNPAKIIRKRFDDTTIKNLLDMKWWNWNDEQLKDKSKFITSPLEFIYLHKKKA